MKAWGWVAGLACAIALLLAPGAAEAKRGYVVQKPRVDLAMHADGSHGYRFSIENRGGSRVVLTVAKGEGSAAYSVAGRATRDSLTANFGNLGRVAVRFHPTSSKPKPELLPFECNGRHPIRESGSFDGTIRFRGERGYASLSLDHVRGSVERSFRRTCKLPPWLVPERGHKHRGRSEEGDELVELTVLAAASKAHRRAVMLQYVSAALEPGHGKKGFVLTLILAAVRESRGRIQIKRSTLVSGDNGSLQASPPGADPVTATLTLPSPFVGSASYSQSAGAEPVWSGSLGVHLPGVDRLPLAGPGFVAAFCRETSIRRLERCLSPAGKKAHHKGAFGSARPQGNGSHSQAFWDARLSWSR
jgi:hypothetical protein